MNERIKKLREASLRAIPSISSERAELITEFYKSRRAYSVSIPVQRAMAFQYIMEKKKLYIHEKELIVGERGPAPKATPTYPEVCAHSLKDLDILNSREKVSFTVDDSVTQSFKSHIIPFWKGRSMRDRIFKEMTKEPSWILN